MNSELLSRLLLSFYVIISILSVPEITAGLSVALFNSTENTADISIDRIGTLTNLIRNRRQATCNGFKCTTIEQCIDVEKRCDGTVDCKDGSDEFNDCKTDIDCPGFLFTCDYGACIEADKECNGKKDCRDNSDEANCVINGPTDSGSSNCKSDQFQCKSGQCIALDDKCNGITDCTDKSDETKETCFNMYCPGFTFKCDYGACVDGDARCNGKKDCVDNSDEEDCEPVVVPTPGPTKKPPKVPPPIGGDGCELPDHPDFGQWSIFGGIQAYPKQKVDVNTVLEFRCNEGYKLTTESSLVACKSNQQWNVNQMPACQKKCSPLYTTEVTNIQCKDSKNAEIKCDEAIHGTSATFSCAPYYESPDRNINSKTVTRYCWSGSWNLPPPVCQPVCGEKKVTAVPLIINGTKVEKGDYPWVTALYKVTSNYLNICGGSMLTQRVILTAAHCVTDAKGNVIDKDAIEVAVGKYYNKYRDPRETQAQYSKLAQIIVPSSYKGDSQHYTSDIALLITKDVLLLSKVVQPVCYQDLPSINLEFGFTGVITGWGYTEATGTPSDELKELAVPFKPDSICYQELPSEWSERYYTQDKMCAGHYNKSVAVCQGDSGGGLVFKNQKDHRYYVHGIVSLAPRENGGCNIEVSSLYTKVASHYGWLEKIISQYLRV